MLNVILGMSVLNLTLILIGYLHLRGLIQGISSQRLQEEDQNTLNQVEANLNRRLQFLQSANFAPRMEVRQSYLDSNKKG